MSKRSCISLIAFSLAAAAIASIAFSLFGAAALVAATGTGTVQEAEAASNAQDKDASSSLVTVQGVLTDAKCEGRHQDQSMTAADCARTCVRQGSHYELVDGATKYEIGGNQQAELAQLAGRRVTVKGRLSGEKIEAVSVQQ